MIEEKKLVAGNGYGNANIFFLNGFPLSEDIRTGLSLSGNPASMIDEFLKPHGIGIKNCYKSTFIKEKLDYSGHNQQKRNKALQSVNVKLYEEQLLEELCDIKPNVIVPLDDLALGAVFPHIYTIKSKPKGRKHWIYCYRGSILPLRSDWQDKLGYGKYVRVIPSIGPQLLYNDWTARSYTQIDYKRIAENQYKTKSIDEYGLIWIADTAKKLEGFFERNYRNAIPKRLTFDIETFGGFITCISFTYDNFEAVTVPLGDPEIPKHERLGFYKLISKALADARVEKNNQNIKYDWIILERHGFLVSNVRSDTMLKGAVLYTELPKGLDFYTSIYTPIPYYKDEGKEFNPRLHTKNRLYIYCGKDSLAAGLASTEMDKELEENNLKEFYETEVAPSILIYKNLDSTGILIDDDVRSKLRGKYAGLYESNLSTLRLMLGNDKFNPRSPAQVGQLVYEELKYPKRTKTDIETGRISYKTDKDTLDDLLINFADATKSGKIGEAILSRTIVCRKIGLIQNYIETPIHPDMRFRSSSNISGTETGRTSFSKTIDERYREDHEFKPGKVSATVKLGRSLQTITKHGFKIDDEIFDDFEDKNIASDIRTMFVPRRDFVFIECDGNSAEARVVFVLAEDYEGLADCDRKPKKHAKTAAMLYGIDVNTITKDYPSIPKVGLAYYDIGKKVRHAGNYGMEEFRLAQMTKMGIGECKQLLDKFHTLEPGIRGKFHAEVIKRLNKFEPLTNPIGRTRMFFGRREGQFYKEGFAQIPQSTIGDLTKFTMWRVAEDLHKTYMKLFFFQCEAHDGVLSEVHKDYKEPYIESYKKHAERKIDFRKCSLSRDIELSIPIEVSIGETNWKDMVEIKL